MTSPSGYTVKPLVWADRHGAEWANTALGVCYVEHLDRPNINGVRGWVAVGPMANIQPAVSREDARGIVWGWHLERLKDFVGGAE